MAKRFYYSSQRVRTKWKEQSNKIYTGFCKMTQKNREKRMLLFREYMAVVWYYLQCEIRWNGPTSIHFLSLYLSLHLSLRLSFFSFLTFYLMNCFWRSKKRSFASFRLCWFRFSAKICVVRLAISSVISDIVVYVNFTVHNQMERRIVVRIYVFVGMFCSLC